MNAYDQELKAFVVMFTFNNYDNAIYLLGQATVLPNASSRKDMYEVGRNNCTLNLKSIGPHLQEEESKCNGQWYETGLGKASWIRLGEKWVLR